MDIFSSFRGDKMTLNIKVKLHRMIKNFRVKELIAPFFRTLQI